MPPTAPQWRWTSPCCLCHSPTQSVSFWPMVQKTKRKNLFVLFNCFTVLLSVSWHYCPAFLQAVLETQTRLSPLTCMCLMTVATRGCWLSGAPIIMLYWTLEGYWWLWSTPALQWIKSSEYNWETDLFIVALFYLFIYFYHLSVSHVYLFVCFFVALCTLFPPILCPPTPSRFSTDEGQCWHTYNFTSDPLHFSGMDSEPGSRSMNVSLWGYKNDFSKWVVITIDFRKLFSRDCEYVGECGWRLVGVTGSHRK